MSSGLPWSAVMLRVGLAALAGCLLGLERESHGRAAGLRTTMLVCVSASIAMILSQDFFIQSTQPGLNWRPDPARLAAGVLTGIGFLGGGAIIRQGNLVRGVTTAAVLWFVTILGLAFGSGQLWLGTLGFGIALVSLLVMPYFENMIPNDWYGSVLVVVGMKGATNEEIHKCITDGGVSIKKVDLNYDLVHGTRSLHCDLKFKKGDLTQMPQEIVHQLIEQPGVLQVKWM